MTLQGHCKFIDIFPISISVNMISSGISSEHDLVSLYFIITAVTKAMNVFPEKAHSKIITVFSHKTGGMLVS